MNYSSNGGYSPAPTSSSIYYGPAGGPTPNTSSYPSGTPVYTPPPNSGYQAVLGTSTQSSPVPAPQPTSSPTTSAPASDPYASIKSGISDAWDNYISSLGGVQSDLQNQNTAQTGIVNDQYNAGLNAANYQKSLSLKDIANNTRSAFQAGNNYLGSLGAGDSSAANQYAFAINQQSGKQVGDLNNFVNNQIQNLGTQRDTQLNQIANWFSQAQATLKQQIAQGGANKAMDLNSLSTNILNQAIAATQQVHANAQNQYNALLSWAANNSSNMSQLQQNIAAIPGALDGMQINQPNSMSYYTGYSPYGTSSQRLDIFGNPVAG